MIQFFGHILISSAGAISSVKCSGYFEGRIKPLGMFHLLVVKMQQAIIWVAMEDAKVTHECNNNDLCNQAETRQQKEELLRNKDLMKATPE